MVLSRQPARRRFAIGLALALSTTLIAAFQPVVIRYGAMRLDPLLYSAGAAISAGLFAAPLLHWRGELRLLADRRYALRLFCLSMSGTVMTTLALVWGLRKIDAIAGVLLLQSEPIYSLVLATAIVGERPAGRQILATAIIAIGIGSVFAGGVFTPAYAVVLILMTPFFWQIAHILSLPVMPPLSPVCITGARYLYGALVFTPMLLIGTRHDLAAIAEPTTLAVLALTGIVIFFIGSMTWYGAISRLSLSWTTALVVPGVPILATLFAFLFLGERATLRELAGIAIAIAGVLMLVLGVDPHRRHPAGESAEAIHPTLD